MPTGDFSFTESFDKVDGAGLGPDQTWGALGWHVVGQYADPPSTGAVAWVNRGDVPADQYAQAVVHLHDPLLTINCENTGPAVRIAGIQHYRVHIHTYSGPGDPVLHWYIVLWGENMGGVVNELVEIDEPAFPLTLRIEAVGDQLSGYLNDELLVQTTATVVSSGYVGMFGGQAKLDSFVAGETAHPSAILDPDGDVLRDPAGLSILEPLSVIDAGSPGDDAVAYGPTLSADTGQTLTAGSPARTPVAYGASVAEPGTGEAQTIPAGVAIEGPVAYGAPVTRVGDFTPRIAATLYHRDNLRVALSDLPNAYARNWQEILNEAGSGGLTLGNEDEDVALIGLDTCVRFTDDGFAAFCMLVRDIDRQHIAQGEEHDQETKVTGPGHIAILEEALVWPSRGVGVTPIQEERGFNWTSTDYDDQWWGYADALVQQGGPYSGSALHDPTGATGSYWAGMPPEWPDPAAWWIWAHWPNSLEWAPEGSCYFRTVFTAPPRTATLEYYVVFDGIGDLYVDGQLFDSGEYGTEPDIDVYSNTVEVSPGEHTIAIRCENDPDPEGDEIHNPGGLLFTAYVVDAAGQRLAAEPIVSSNNTWKIVEYPPGPPGMSPGEVIRHVIGEAQERGALGMVTLNFTDEVDSAGKPWPMTTDIATKVGYDLWTFFKEMAATYVDLWMEPSSFRLWAWNKGGRGETKAVTLTAPTDPMDPATGNLKNLSYHTVT